MLGNDKQQEEKYTSNGPSSHSNKEKKRKETSIFKQNTNMYEQFKNKSSSKQILTMSKLQNNKENMLLKPKEYREKEYEKKTQKENKNQYQKEKDNEIKAMLCQL